MDEPTLRAYISQYIEAQAGDVVTLAWQGGEPTLMGLDFFRAAVTIASQSTRPGVTVEQTIQTNGTLLDEEWCAFLQENDSLGGLNSEGPQPLHAAYRRVSLDHWATAFAAGERSLRRPAALVPGVEVVGIDPLWLTDADTPQDLPDGGG